MKKLIVLTWLFLVGVACSSDNNNKNKKIENFFEPREIEMETIAQGDYFGNSVESEFRVIQEQSEWNDLLDNSHMRSYITNPLFFEIDFTQFDIVVVFDEGKATGGHSIDIVNVVEEQERVVVNIDRILKGDDTLIAPRPFHIVKISKLGKPVVFEEL